MSKNTNVKELEATFNTLFDEVIEMRVKYGQLAQLGAAPKHKEQALRHFFADIRNLTWGKDG